MIAEEIEFFELGFDTRTGYSYKNGPFFGLWQDPVAREPNGGWRWRNGEPLDYTNWAPGMPLDDRTGHAMPNTLPIRQGQVDLTKADARRWFDNDGTYATVGGDGDKLLRPNATAVSAESKEAQ